MIDMDDARRSSGTAADLSGWELNMNGFKKMNITSSEKVIETQQEPQEQGINKTAQRAEQQKRQAPGTGNRLKAAPEEIKMLAVSLLPKVDVAKQEEFELYAAKAVQLALVFENFWEKNVQVG